MRAKDRYYLSREFQLREDLLGADILMGWVGVLLDRSFRVNQGADCLFLDAVKYIENYYLQCGVSGDTTLDDMESHWDEVTSLFKTMYMQFVETE